MTCHGMWDLSKQWHVTASEIRVNNDMSQHVRSGDMSLFTQISHAMTCHCLLRSHTPWHVIVYSDLTCHDMSLLTQISLAVTCHCLLRSHMLWHVIVYSDLTCCDMSLFTRISHAVTCHCLLRSHMPWHVIVYSDLTCLWDPSKQWHVTACEIQVNNDMSRHVRSE
jgi:hypothetical protein